MNATVAYAHAIASRKVEQHFAAEEQRCGKVERRRLPRGRGRRSTDSAVLTQAEITEMVAREPRACWSCGTPLVGPDGHACNGSSMEGPSPGRGSTPAQHAATDASPSARPGSASMSRSA